MSIEVVDQQSFEAAIEEGLVLVDFYADWCGPCKMMLPTLERLDAENPGLKIIKVNVDSDHDLAVKHNIRGIPALVLYKDGWNAGTLVGAHNKAKLDEFIKQ